VDGIGETQNISMLHSTQFRWVLGVRKPELIVSALIIPLVLRSNRRTRFTEEVVPWPKAFRIF
jgi:hypothetical protein